jgi:hypothetical protein
MPTLVKLSGQVYEQRLMVDKLCWTLILYTFIRSSRGKERDEVKAALAALQKEIQEAKGKVNRAQKKG